MKIKCVQKNRLYGICIPVKDYQVHLPISKLEGGVLSGTSVSALLPNPPVVLEFILLVVVARQTVAS